MLILQSKVYAVMAYHDQPLQYISKYYFRTKAGGDDHYDVIYTIMSLMGALPFALWIGFIMLAIVFIFPQVSTLVIKLSLAKLKKVEICMKKLSKAGNEVKILKLTEGENENGVYLVELKSTVYEQELSEMIKTNGAYVKDECKKYMIDLSASNKWRIREMPLLCLSIFLNIALFAFHIFSTVEIIKYRNDVLQSHQDSGNDHSSSLIAITLSFITIVVTYISGVIISVYRLCKEGFDTKSLVVSKSTKEPLNLRTLAAMFVTMNIIHIVCYFMPYMLLAFIYNPLQTCVTYLALGLYVLCAYLLFWILEHCCISLIKLFNSHTTDHEFLTFYTSPNNSESDSVDGNDINLQYIYIFIIQTVYLLLGTGIVFAQQLFSFRLQLFMCLLWEL